MNYSSLIVLIIFVVLILWFSKFIPKAFRNLCRIFFEERERAKRL